MTEVYQPSLINGRRRATKAEMEARADFLIDYAERHGPVTVRQLYYQAEVAGLPGIDKTEYGYCKIQHQVLELRRCGRLDYGLIADATRWMRKPTTYDSVQEAIDATARFYRKSLWADAEAYVEVWCEKDALAGVILPITSKYDVPLMVARGYSSETFCYEAIAARDGDDRDYYVYYLGDFDRSGRDAANALKEKLTRFAEEDGIEVIFKQIAVTRSQVEAWSLPTRPHKRVSPADKKWPHAFACELDAIEPDLMRHMVERAINDHIDQEQLDVLMVAEESERKIESVRPSREAAITRGRVALAAKLSTARLTKSARFGWWRTKGSQQHDAKVCVVCGIEFQASKGTRVLLARMFPGT